MSPVSRPMSGDTLRFDLGKERATVHDPALLAQHGRNARTLLKEGPLRVALVMIAAGGGIPPHHAQGPLTVHVLDGDIRFTVAGTEHQLKAGDLLVVNAGLEHAVASTAGGTFLLTVVQQQA